MIFLRPGMKGQGFFGCTAVLLLAASEKSLLYGLGL